MRLVVLANDELKAELLEHGCEKEIDLKWIEKSDDFFSHNDADGFIDLLFDDDEKRAAQLQKLFPKPVFINSISFPVASAPFIRLNGWPTFLKRPLVEAVCADNDLKQQAEKILFSFNKKIEWLPDEPGFISTRIVSMIINEAYFALEENISSKEQIDIAMKLGTNYPYGPFEWAQKIGLKRIYQLLSRLSEKDESYKPASFLQKEALS